MDLDDLLVSRVDAEVIEARVAAEAEALERSTRLPDDSEVLAASGMSGVDASDDVVRSTLLRLKSKLSRPTTDAHRALLRVIRAALSPAVVFSEPVAPVAPVAPAVRYEPPTERYAPDSPQRQRPRRSAESSDLLGGLLSEARAPRGSKVPPATSAPPALRRKRADERVAAAVPRKRPKPLPVAAMELSSGEEESEDDAFIPEEDDDDEAVVAERARKSAAELRRWNRRWRRAPAGSSLVERDAFATSEDAPAPTASAPPPEDVPLTATLSIPRMAHAKLYDYQIDGIKWLHNLHTQRCGGILGDEMGLGKTVQVAVFLYALQIAHGDVSCLLVCPATTLGQWLFELHRWAPSLRVHTLHSSSSSGVTASDKIEEFFPTNRDADATGNVLLTTYAGMKKHCLKLFNARFQYIVLDEGHVIRNPNADVTLVAKSIPTPHRLILTGSPIQNNLTELWSLLDFVYPGRLGTLPHFQANFSKIIDAGSFKNATPLAVNLAYQCAKILKESITPYLLRRTKKSVNLSLPSKTEQVLFCPLSDSQKELYQDYLQRDDVRCLITKSSNSRRNEDKRKALTFKAIRALQQICNHPMIADEDADFDIAASGKMLVLQRILRSWVVDEHRKCLVFSQSTKMLDVLELLLNHENITFLRMDGSTPISKRTKLISTFNRSASISVFLLSTKVGGLGINLTGASRVVLYDPDWNPATDAQARERVFRLGQTQDVIIYRLLCSGTIEEKIYHRAVFKSFLTSKILDDPSQRRFFKSNALRDLFTLDISTSTSDLFASHGVDVDAQANDLVDVLDDALSHDKVEMAAKSQPEALILREQASRIAKRSHEALMRERARIASVARPGLPTWTGAAGIAGGPTHSFGGASSRALLEQVADEGDAPVSSLVAHWKAVAADLSEFLGTRGRTSNELLSRFSSAVASAPDSSQEQSNFVFRSLLRRIASNRGNVWRKDV